MRVLVTGIAGFAGSHLAELLLQQPDIEVHGIIHRHEWRLQAIRSRLQLHRGDMRNALWVDELIQNVRPQGAFHLAAWSDVGGSWQQPWTTYELNIQCQLNLLEALYRHASECRTVVVTSNEVYGQVSEVDLPIDESTPLRPNSPYGVSKIAQDMMALQYWNSRRLPTLRMRSFNHIGPRQSEEFVASALARQIAEIDLGLRDPVVEVGNLAARRDFTDVRDIVRAYWMVMQSGTAGDVYNVGSGVSHAVHTLLDILVELSMRSVDVVVDPRRLRPSEVPESVCDNTKLRAITGWSPEYSLHDSLQSLLQEWRMWLKNRTETTGSSLF